MPSYDFEVDLAALSKAAESTARALEMVREHDVEDFVPSASVLGHPDVSSAVDEFKNRWEKGLRDLVADIEEISGRLAQSTNTYAQFDEDGYTGFTALAERLKGEDPFSGL